MRKSHIYLYLLGIIVALSSCGSGGETLNFASIGDNTSVQEVITGKWKLSQRKVAGKQQVVKDCEADNTLEIQGDGAYVWDNGVTQCNEGETNDVGTWSLSDNDKELTFTGNETTQVVNLVGIDNTKFVLEVSVKNNGKTQLETHTYIKVQ